MVAFKTLQTSLVQQAMQNILLQNNGLDTDCFSHWPSIHKMQNENLKTVRTGENKLDISNSYQSS